MAHPFAADDKTAESYKEYRTFTHGDPKQANLFFRPDGDSVEVGLIDFQWSGFGLAATDVAHFMTAAVHADLLEGVGESKLLNYYHAELTKYLAEYGAFDSPEAASAGYDYETFLGQYETGVLDMCRLVIAYAWSRFETVDDDDEVGKARTANKNSYNKSVANVVWLMTRCDSILKARGA